MARAISAMGSFSPVLECTQVTATILVRGRTALTSVSTRLSWVTLRKASYRGDTTQRGARAFGPESQRGFRRIVIVVVVNIS